MTIYHTTTYTPILNTSHFDEVFGGTSGMTLPLDEQGLFRSLETVLFPTTEITAHHQLSEHIVEVSTKAYPHSGSFFTDIRFLQRTNSPKLIRTLPSQQEILDTLFSLVGSRYWWGGNCSRIPEMLAWYPPKRPLSQEEEKNWTLSGFDCSGLMYYAAQGVVPRNTSSWISFGKAVPVEKKSPREILSILQPLDAIVWKGHIIFILDGARCIESRKGYGVIITSSLERLEELLVKDQRIPKDTWTEGFPQFLVRRWHSA
ncbi:MAG: NlpC/P60 family protein [Chlamydiae bacterium]|nr:NlpC/P60 family protein [Chlamydiota bacterium]